MNINGQGQKQVEDANELAGDKKLIKQCINIINDNMSLKDEFTAEDERRVLQESLKS